MPVTISFTADSSGVTQETAKVKANLSAAFAGIQAQMRQMETASGSATTKMITGLQQMAAELKPAVFGLNNLSASLLKTGQAAGATTTQLQKFARQSQDTAKASEQAAESQKKFGSAITGTISGLRSLAAGFGLLLGAQGLITFVKSVVDAGLQMERFERTLTAATGSSKASAEAWRFITAESNRLGQSVEAMVPIFVQLTAATRNTVLEGERTRELFSALAGAGQAVGLSTEAVGGAMLGLTQIISQNAIQLDEFRNQFASRIPGAMLETAKALKVLGVTSQGTIAEMLKGFEKGTITIPQFTQAVTMALREIQRTAPEMGNTAAAAFTQLGNAAFQLKADLARSGLLEFMTNMAQTARGLLARVREAIGAGGRDFLGQVSDIQGQLAKLRQQRQELQEEAPRSNLESTLRLEGLLGTTQAERLKKLNEEIGLQEEKLRVLTQIHKSEADADAEKAKTDQARRDKEAADLKAIDDAAKRSREGAQDAAARARAQTGLVQERVQQEKIALDQLQAVRAQALEQDYEMAVQNTEQTKAAQAQIETAFAIRRLDIARQSALEDATLQEKTAIQTRDVRIAAIKAADAAAQAAATDPKATAEAQVTASKRSAAAAIELQTVTLNAQNSIQEAVKKRTEAEAAYEKGVSAVVKGERADQIKITEAQLQREAQMRQHALQGQASILSAETALVQAQVDGLVLTEAEGLTQRQTLERQALDVRRMLLEESFQNELRLLNEKVKANQATQDDITALQTQHTKDLQVINLERQTQAQEHQNELLKDWREWVKDVRSALGDFLFRWMDGQVHSMKEVLLDLKSWFFRLIADMAAKAATSAIIVPILTAVVGSVGGGGGGLLAQAGAAIGGGGTGGGGGLLGTAGTALSGIGMARQLMSFLGLDSLTGSIKAGLTTLREVLGQGLSDLFSSAATRASQAALENATAASELGFETTGQVGTGAASAGVGTAATVMGIAGGLAALGAGIYGALNASNNAAKAAYAASAAAGAAAAGIAAYGAITGGAVVIAGTTGWTGIGLIVAAVMAVIGVVLDRVIKPAGPNLAVGQPAGIGVGVEGGKLITTGRATSNVMREEGVSPEQAGAVQKALNEGITAAVNTIIQTINAVALDPAKLLGPTQDALRKALSEVQTINSASAKHMEKDIAEQHRFTNTALVANLLEPVNMAFEQLVDSDLETQLNRLPITTIGLVEIFKTLNTQLDEMAKGENRDVLGQIQGTREAIQRFGVRLAKTAGETAEQIVNGVITEFDDAIERTQPLKLVSDFSHNLATLITTFNERMTDGLQALVTLQKTQRTLEDAGLPGGGVGAQIDRLTPTLSQQAEIFSTQIVTRSLDNLASQLDKIVIQPIRIQATTVDSLFTDSLAALNELWLEWHRLEDVGIDATRVQEQFTRLLGGALDSASNLLRNALVRGTFPEFLDVLLSIPDALAKMNPVFERLKALGQAFAQVVGPIQQAIQQGEEQLRTPQQRMENTAAQMDQLEAAIADAGTSAEKALPLYAQLAQAITANAAAQIAAVQQVGSVIDQITSILDARGGTSAQLARVNQRINTAPGGGQGSIENISTLVTLYGQQLELLAQLRQTIEAGLESIDETLRADETVSTRAARLVAAVPPRPSASATPEELLAQASALQDAIGAVRELIDVIEQGLQNIRDILHANETIAQRATRLLAEVTTGPQPQTAEGLIDLASAMGDALGAIRALIDLIEQGLDRIRQSLQANETVAQRVTRLMAEVTTGPQPQTTEGLIELAGAMGDALGAIRELINMIEQGLEGIRQTLHANETVSTRATRLVSELRTPAGDARDPAVLIDVAGQIGEALTAVRALMDLLQSGIDSIDQTLFSLLSAAEQATQLQGKIATINASIATAGKATPEQLIELVGLTQQSLSLQQQMTQALQSTLEDLKASVEGTGPPVETIATARAQVAALQSLVDTGQATPEQLQQLVDANQQLLDVGRQFDLLDVQQEALDNLKGLAPVIEKQIEDSQAREQLLTDSLVGIKGALEAQVIAAQTTETALVGLLTTIEGQLVSALAVAVETETWLITQLTVIQQWLEAQLITARTTEQWLISQLTVIQQWLQFQLTAAQATETALVLQLLSIKGALDAQLAQIATAEAITIRYLDAQLIALNAQLLAQYGTTDVQNIIKQIQQWQLDELRDLNARLKDLFLDQPDAQNLFGVQHELEGQSAKMDTQSFALSSLVNQTNTVINKLDDVNRSLNTPLRTTPAQSGGWLYASLNRAATGPLGYARGGMVNAILEPGETVFPPPFTSSQKKTLTSMNTEFPRFTRGGWTVPGAGDGDHVPALLADGSFVLNRTASRTMGFQAGGSTSYASNMDRILRITVNLGPIVDTLIDIEKVLTGQTPPLQAIARLTEGVFQQLMQWDNEWREHRLARVEDEVLFGLYEESRKQTALMQVRGPMAAMARGGWTVPGSGSGDQVPAMLPSGSFVLNRRASQARGYQAGGPVQGSVSTNHVTINIQVYQQPGQSGRELVQEITRQLRREFRTKNDDSPFR